MKMHFLLGFLILNVLSGGLILARESSEDNDLFYDYPTPNFCIRWAFQKECDHHYDPRGIHDWPTPCNNGPFKTFDPALVKPGDMIFVRDAQQYFKEMHPKVKVPVFLMTHGEYLDRFQESYFKYLDRFKNILGWFTIHPHATHHERVFPLPLGVIQYIEIYENREDMSKKFHAYRKAKKTKLLYSNFTDWRMPERTKIRESFRNKSFCTTSEGRLRFHIFIEEMAQHKFTLSPPGLGSDCYRVYESLLMGSIPIVQHSHIDHLYEGLPVLFIDSWDQVTEEFLNKKYAEIRSKKYNPEKLFMEYWLDYIRITRQQLWTQYVTEHPEILP